MTISTTIRPDMVPATTRTEFSEEQLRRLLELRQRYHPFREWCESDREYFRFCFLKWRVECGDLRAG